MKRISLIISLVVLFALGANAQNGDLKFGLKLGPNFGWASSGSEVTENHGARLGFDAGLVVDYYLTNVFAASTGVEFNFYRMKYDFTDYRSLDNILSEEKAMVSRRLKASNLEIPLKVKAKFNVADSFDAFVEAGFGLGFNLKDYGKDEFKFYWNMTDEPNFQSAIYEDCTGQYRVLQASMIFGLGAEYELNQKLSVFALLSFHHAFSNAFNKALAEQTGSILRNNFIGIEVGVMH